MINFERNTMQHFISKLRIFKNNFKQFMNPQKINQ